MLKVAGNDIFENSRSEPIPWTKISNNDKFKKYKRNPWQCQAHWQKVLAWKLSNPNNEWRSGWTKLDSAKLIYILYHAPWTTEFEIDWDIVKEIFA